MSNVQVIERKAEINGQELFLKIVKMDDKEGWMSRQIKEYFDLEDSAFKKALVRSKVKGVTFRHPQLTPLKQANVVPMRTTFMDFYTAEDVAKIAAHVNSDSAKEMLVHGFNVGVAAARGDVAKVQELTGQSASVDDFVDRAERNGREIIELAQQLREARAKASAEEAARKQAEATITSINGNAVSYAIKMGYKAWQIVTEYPQAAEEALTWGRAIGIYPFKGYEKQGVMTRWLREVHDIHSVSSRVDFSSKRGDTALYDRNVIDKLMEKLGYVKKGTQS